MDKLYTKLFTFLVFASLFISEAFALSTNKEWLNLLHYQNGKSLISDRSFFLSPEGMFNPEDELKANIENLSKKEMLSCKFPARTLYLMQRYESFRPATDLKDCTSFQDYLNNLSAKEIYIVFATEKFNSPLSMMGHSFIKVVGERDDFHPTHSLSFFANLGSFDNLLTFIPKAISTGMDGMYKLEPYSQRYNSYVNEDGRNLVSYNLELNAAEVERFIYHVWELKGINVSYNLKDHNCASALVTLLQVVKDDFSLVNDKSYITPSDIINKFIKNDLIQYDRTDLANGFDSYSVKPSGSSRYGLYALHSNDDFYLNFKYSLAYQDIMDLNFDNDHEFEVKLFSVDMNYTPNKLNLEKLTLFGTKYFNPASVSDFNWSTMFEVSFDNERFDIKDSSLKPYVSISRGVTISIGDKKHLMPYFFLQASYHHNDSKDLMISPRFGFISYLNDKNKIVLDVQSYKKAYEYKYSRKSDLKYSYYWSDNRSVNVVSSFIKGQGEQNSYKSIGIGLSQSF